MYFISLFMVREGDAAGIGLGIRLAVLSAGEVVRLGPGARIMLRHRSAGEPAAGDRQPGNRSTVPPLVPVTLVWKRDEFQQD